MTLIALFLFVFFVLWSLFHGKDVPEGKQESGVPVSDGPILTPEQKLQNYRSVRELVEHTPYQSIKNLFPEYVEDIAISKAYDELERKLKVGEISQADYEIELHELSKKINIKVYLK